MLKKFRKNDIYINRVKAYPKVEFFVNSGSVESVYYNRTIEPQAATGSQKSGFVYLNRIINPLLDDPVIIGADFDEGFEFPGWDETAPNIPEPTFSVLSYNENFDSDWDDTAAIPTPTFSGSANYDEPFDTDWDGTPTSSGSLLAENGDNLITEDGDNIIS